MTPSLVAKLCEVMALIPRIEKRGRNEFHQYDYAMEADIVDTIRPLLAERKVFVFPSLVDMTRTDTIVDLKMRWTFEDAESGETRECVFPGSGQDKGDKSAYKALTGSEKYFLLKTFLVATGDDPEKDDTAPRAEAPAAPLPTPPKQPAAVPLMPAYQGPPKTAPVNGGQVWQGQLMNVEARTITSKKTGQTYVIHEFKIALQDGVASAGAGFNEELVDKGKLAVGQMIRAQIVPGQKRGFWNIDSFEVVS